MIPLRYLHFDLWNNANDLLSPRKFDNVNVNHLTRFFFFIAFDGYGDASVAATVCDKFAVGDEGA